MNHSPFHINTDRSSRGVSLVGWCCAVGVICGLMVNLGGCSPDSPPSAEEIRAEGGVSLLELEKPWRATPAEVAGSGVVQDDWLKTFADPQLDALVEEAMRNNPDLRITALKVQQAEQYVELAKAALRPTVNLIGTGGLNMGGGDISSALQGVSLGASWEPDLWGRMRYGRNASQAMFASAEADMEFARQSLAATVAKAWFAACEATLQLDLAGEMIASAEELLTLAENRLRVGPGSDLDVAQARANLASVQDVHAQVDFARGQSLRSLELLLGRYPAAELETRRTLSSPTDPIPTGLPLEMLERRPDILAAERRVAAAFNRVGEAKTMRLPRVILNANVAVIESDILQLKEEFQNPTGGVGAKFIVPIYQGGALKTQVVIRTLEQQQAVAEYARLALQALADVENALAAGLSLATREGVLEQVVMQNEQVLDRNRVQYRVGNADLRTVQQQQMSTDLAKSSLLRVQSEQLAQLANLHLVLGGRFEAVSTTDASEESK